MTALRPYIIYSLPQSRTTQALTGGKIEKVWANIERFLTTCTNADIKSPNSIYLTGYTAAEDHGEHPDLAEKLLKKTHDALRQAFNDKLPFDNLDKYLKFLSPDNDAWKMEAISSMLEMFDFERKRSFDKIIELENVIRKLTQHYKQ